MYALCMAGIHPTGEFVSVEINFPNPDETESPPLNASILIPDFDLSKETIELLKKRTLSIICEGDLPDRGGTGIECIALLVHLIEKSNINRSWKNITITCLLGNHDIFASHTPSQLPYLKQYISPNSHCDSKDSAAFSLLKATYQKGIAVSRLDRSGFRFCLADPINQSITSHAPITEGSRGFLTLLRMSISGNKDYFNTYHQAEWRAINQQLLALDSKDITQTYCKLQGLNYRQTKTQWLLNFEKAFNLHLRLPSYMDNPQIKVPISNPDFKALTANTEANKENQTAISTPFLLFSLVDTTQWLLKKLPPIGDSSSHPLYVELQSLHNRLVSGDHSPVSQHEFNILQTLLDATTITPAIRAQLLFGHISHHDHSPCWEKMLTNAALNHSTRNTIYFNACNGHDHASCIEPAELIMEPEKSYEYPDSPFISIKTDCGSSDGVKIWSSAKYGAPEVIANRSAPTIIRYAKGEAPKLFTIGTKTGMWGGFQRGFYYNELQPSIEATTLPSYPRSADAKMKCNDPMYRMQQVINLYARLFEEVFDTLNWSTHESKCVQDSHLKSR